MNKLVIELNYFNFFERVKNGERAIISHNLHTNPRVANKLSIWINGELVWYIKFSFYFDLMYLLSLHGLEMVKIPFLGFSKYSFVESWHVKIKKSI